MKQFYTLLVLAFTVITANAQLVTIPDANFKARLLAANPSNHIASYENADINGSVGSYNTIDTNQDGEIQLSEALEIRHLNLVGNNIASLSGINSFTNLTSLDCGSNQLTSLNIDGLLNLTRLSCGENLLTSLDVSMLSNLRILGCSFNNLTSLNLNGLNNLVEIGCYYNQLVTIEANNLNNLLYVLCANNRLVSLNLNGSNNLQTVECYSNQLEELTLMNRPNLQELYCNNNSPLTSIYIKGSPLESDFEFSNNFNLQYICTDDFNIATIQNTVNLYGYTNCLVNSTCQLSTEENTLAYFTIYPTPTKEVLNININAQIIVNSVAIYNTLGQLVQVSTNPSESIDVSSLKTGNYVIKIISDKGTASGKFVKE